MQLQTIRLKHLLGSLSYYLLQRLLELEVDFVLLQMEDSELRALAARLEQKSCSLVSDTIVLELDAFKIN